MDKKIFFLILAVKNAVLQSARNLFDKGQPLADQLVLSKQWKRGFKLSDTGEVVQHDDGRARLMRMFWFQAQSVDNSWRGQEKQQYLHHLLDGFGRTVEFF